MGTAAVDSGGGREQIIGFVGNGTGSGTFQPSVQAATTVTDANVPATANIIVSASNAAAGLLARTATTYVATGNSAGSFVFTISATAGGANDAALLANVPGIFTKYGQSVKMQFTNNNTKDVYIVPGTIDANYALYIDGNEYEDDEAFVRQEDATSKTAYGDRSIDIENPFVGAFNTLVAYAQWLVSRFKGINAAGTLAPIPDNVRIHLTNGSSALLVQMLTREISDRITLTVTALGVSAKEYYINKIREEVSEGGMVHDCTWWLERADESKYWLLETAGYGELEQTTRIGF